MKPTKPITVQRWLRAWLASIDDASLGVDVKRKYADLVENDLGSFGETPLSSVKLADAYRLSRSFPRKMRRPGYNFIDYGLRAAKRVGLTSAFPGFPAKRVIAFGFLKAVQFAFVACLALAVVISAMALNRVVRYKEDALTAYATVARENGMGVLVAIAEDIYYGYLHTPEVGGDGTLAQDFTGDDTTSGVVEDLPEANNSLWGPALTPSEVPDRVASPVTPKAGEGIWVGSRIVVNGSTAIRIARIRPDTEHTSYFATLVWLDSKLLAFTQVPGTEVPEGDFDRGNGQVPAELKPFYVAGLNDAFLMRDSQGGYVYGNHVVKKLVNGKATLVTYQDGTLDVLKWGRDNPVKDMQAARQNLTLLVDNGVSQVTDESQSKWGWVWHGVGSGKNLVWRSAIGVRKDGTIVYCIGSTLSARSLADMMVRAGAVTAMPLDMNSAYANGFLYGPYENGKRLDPAIYREPDRFLIPSERDFVAVFAKSP